MTEFLKVTLIEILTAASFVGCIVVGFKVGPDNAHQQEIEQFTAATRKSTTVLELALQDIRYSDKKATIYENEARCMTDATTPQNLAERLKRETECLQTAAQAMRELTSQMPVAEPNKTAWRVKT